MATTPITRKAHHLLTAARHCVPRTRRGAIHLVAELALVAIHPSFVVIHVTVSIVVHGILHRRHRR